MDVWRMLCLLWAIEIMIDHHGLHNVDWNWRTLAMRCGVMAMIYFAIRRKGD